MRVSHWLLQDGSTEEQGAVARPRASARQRLLALRQRRHAAALAPLPLQRPQSAIPPEPRPRLVQVTQPPLQLCLQRRCSPQKLRSSTWTQAPVYSMSTRARVKSRDFIPGSVLRPTAELQAPTQLMTQTFGLGAIEAGFQ